MSIDDDGSDRDSESSSFYEGIEEAIQKRDEAAFRDSFDGVGGEDRKTMLLSIYDSLISTLEVEVVSGYTGDYFFKEKFLFLMTMIYDNYPELSDYMVAEERPGAPREGKKLHIEHMLTPDGIRVVIEYLRNKGSLKLPCRMCDDYETFEKNLRDLPDNKDIRELFIVRVQQRDFKGRVSHHVLPVYIEKKEGEPYKALISDSTGTGQYTFLLQRKILTRFPEARIYVADMKRQADPTSCSIFSLRDVAQISRFEDIFTTLDELNPNKTVRKPKIKFCEILPLEMMKTSQSLSRLDKAQALSPDPKRVIHHGKIDGERVSPETLTENVGRHSVKIVDDRHRNLLVQKRFYKYVRLFLEKIL